MTQRITLKPGDYVSTEGMDESTYHAVARAFIDAGAKDMFRHADRPINQTMQYIEWFGPNICGTSIPEPDGRQLTVEQVLGKAGTTTTNLVTAARTAKTTLDDARSEYTKALDDLREALGEGFVISEAEESPEHDMTDPANWRAGDVVECVARDKYDLAMIGQRYVIESPHLCNKLFNLHIGTDSWCMKADELRFVRRPNT